MINKIVFVDSSIYFGMIIWEDENLILAKNFSDDLDLDGYSCINKSKIKIINSKGKKARFYQKLCELRSESLPSNVDFVFGSMAELLSSLKSTVAIDHIDEGGRSIFFVGLIERIGKKHIGGRYISPLGGVDESRLDKIYYNKIIKVQIGGRYLKAFDLYTGRCGATGPSCFTFPEAAPLSFMPRLSDQR